MIFGLVTTYNLLVMFSFVAAGVGMYLLAKYLTNSRVSSFIAGVIFSFCPYHLARAWGHLNLVTIQWIPLYILFLIKAVRERDRKNLLFAAFFLFLNATGSLIYFAYLLIFTFLFAGYYFIFKRNFEKELICRIATICFLGMIFTIPIAYPLIEGFLTQKMEMPSLDIAIAYSPDLLNFFTPSIEHFIFGKFVARTYYEESLSVAESITYVGISVLFLTIYTIIKLNKREKEINFWAWMGLSFFVLSLGPFLHINGEYIFKGIIPVIPLPYLLIAKLPLFSIGRVPTRFVIFGMLSVAILCAYGLREIINSFKKKVFWISKGYWVSIIFLALIIFEFLPTHDKNSEIGLVNTSIPGIYKEISMDNRSFAILEYPGFDWCTTQYIYYQTTHKKYLVNGYAGRVNPNSTILDALNQSSMLNQDLPKSGSGILKYYNISYIILHESCGRGVSLDQKTLEDYTQQFSEITHDNFNKSGDLLIYKVKEGAAAEGVMANFGEGWYDKESLPDGTSWRWMVGNADIDLINFEKNEMCVNFTFSTTTYGMDRLLQIFLNERLIDEITVHQGPEKKQVSLDILLNSGTNKISFRDPTGGTVIDLMKDTRKLSFMFHNISIRSIDDANLSKHCNVKP